MNRYFIIYKPYEVLSQFSTEGSKKTLKDFFELPSDVYPVGRLDFDSEGLLLLTNDKKINHSLLHPAFAHKRIYWVQVEGLPGADALQKLAQGVLISVNGKPYRTALCEVKLFNAVPLVPERNPPIRFRKNIATSWLQLTLTEGKNRQVRKMTAAIGYPTLRLIRYSMEQLNIAGLLPGDIREYTLAEIEQALFKK